MKLVSLSIREKREKRAEEEYKKSIFYTTFSLVKNKKKLVRIGIIPYVNCEIIKNNIKIKEFEASKNFSLIEKYPKEIEDFILNQNSENKFWFSLGLDSSFGELTDFGGYKKKTDYNISTSANRELKEESKNIFDISELKYFKKTKSNIENIIDASPCIVYDNIYCITFIDFTSLYYKIGFPYNISDIFKAKSYEIRDSNENSDCMWIPMSELKKIIKKRTPPITKKKEMHCSGVKVSEEIKDKIKLNCYPYFYEKIRVIIYPYMDILENVL